MSNVYTQIIYYSCYFVSWGNSLFSLNTAVLMNAEMIAFQWWMGMESMNCWNWLRWTKENLFVALKLICRLNGDWDSCAVRDNLKSTALVDELGVVMVKDGHFCSELYCCAAWNQLTRSVCMRDWKKLGILLWFGLFDMLVL